jgi:HEAT repeat protein
MHFARSTLLALLLAAAATAQAAPDAAGAEKRAPTADEELALAALEGLMAQPPQRSLPILKKVMAGPQSALVKRRALFVLGQVNSPEAREILLQTARSTDDGLRGEAIRSIGIGGDAKSLDALQEIYNAGSADVKKDVLQAWMIAGRKQSVYQAALNAKTEDEASAAIHMLGVMGAFEELRKLGDKPMASKSLIHAYAIAGDVAGLRKIADTATDRSLRIDATRSIGIIHNDAARTALREIYASTQDDEIRDAALQGMLISQDEQGVLALYRAAKTTDEKRSLLRMLSMMNGDAALQAIDAALEKK